MVKKEELSAKQHLLLCCQKAVDKMCVRLVCMHPMCVCHVNGMTLTEKSRQSAP